MLRHRPNRLCLPGHSPRQAFLSLFVLPSTKISEREQSVCVPRMLDSSVKHPKLLYAWPGPSGSSNYLSLTGAFKWECMHWWKCIDGHCVKMWTVKKIMVTIYTTGRPINVLHIALIHCIVRHLIDVSMYRYTLNMIYIYIYIYIYINSSL